MKELLLLIIGNGQIVFNGMEVFWLGEIDWCKVVYQVLEIDYLKFYKMDCLV